MEFHPRGSACNGSTRSCSLIPSKTIARTSGELDVSISLSDLFQKSRMTEWVAVCADEAEEPVEIPTETDGKWG